MVCWLVGWLVGGRGGTKTKNRNHRDVAGKVSCAWEIEDDHKGALLNSMRTGTLIADADVVVVRFGEKYKQWNAAFDAGYAAALGKPLIILHPPEHDHALKEVDAAAKAVAREPHQVVEALAYAIRGVMPQ